MLCINASLFMFIASSSTYPQSQKLLHNKRLYGFIGEIEHNKYCNSFCPGLTLITVPLDRWQNQVLWTCGIQPSPTVQSYSVLYLSLTEEKYCCAIVCSLRSPSRTSSSSRVCWDLSFTQTVWVRSSTLIHTGNCMSSLHFTLFSFFASVT